MPQQRRLVDPRVGSSHIGARRWTIAVLAFAWLCYPLLQLLVRFISDRPRARLPSVSEDAVASPSCSPPVTLVLTVTFGAMWLAAVGTTTEKSSYFYQCMRVFTQILRLPDSGRCAATPAVAAVRVPRSRAARLSRCGA